MIRTTRPSSIWRPDRTSSWTAWPSRAAPWSRSLPISTCGISGSRRRSPRSQAGQYAAVLYATPDASISQYSELQTLCQQAADTFHTRTRFDFYSDFIADPATADLLLARLVRQLSALRQDVTLQATLPALPLSITDHVAVHAPLLGPQPFVGELRRAALAFAAQAPGMALRLTLRQSGLVRGAWEAWDVGALGTAVAPSELDAPGGVPPECAETWPDTGGTAGRPGRQGHFRPRRTSRSSWIP